MDKPEELQAGLVIELPVSSNALETSATVAEEELPVSSPVPSGYAVLSDSYLSPGKATLTVTQGDRPSVHSPVPYRSRNIAMQIWTQEPDSLHSRRLAA